MKKQSKASAMLWRIFISILGAVFVFLSVSRLTLFFVGETAIADVNTRRTGGANDGRPVSHRYMYSVDYTFCDQNGIAYNGSTTRYGSDIGLTVENKVYYLAAAPFINALEKEAEPGLGQLLLCVAGVFLVFFVNVRKDRKKQTKMIS